MKDLIEKILLEKHFAGVSGWEPGTGADGWSLLAVGDGAKDGEVDKAVKALNIAMAKAEGQLKKEMAKIHTFDADEIGPKAGEIFGKIVEPILKKHKQVGSNDTEPRYVAVQGLINMVKKHYGIKGWTMLGDYIG